MFSRAASGMESFSSTIRNLKHIVGSTRGFASTTLLSSPFTGIRLVPCTKIPPTGTQRRSIVFSATRLITEKKQAHVGSMLPFFSIVNRGIKTKKAASKRFIKTGSGNLKYGRAGKRHNTSKKTKTVKRRLNKKVRVVQK